MHRDRSSVLRGRCKGRNRRYSVPTVQFVPMCYDFHMSRDPLHSIDAEVKRLEGYRDRINMKIAALKESAALLRPLYAGTGEGAGETIGITDEVRNALSRAESAGLTPPEIRDIIVENGFEISRYQNVMATIHQILKRLVNRGEARIWKEGAQARYALNETAPPGTNDLLEPDTMAAWRNVCLSIRNPEIRTFFITGPDRGWARPYPRERRLVFRDGSGKEGWRVEARYRRDYAWTMQNGRFDGDVEFWKEKLSAAHSVRVLRGGARVYFHLLPADLTGFVQLVTEELRAITLVG